MEEPFGSCDPDVCEFTTFSGLKKKKKSENTQRNNNCLTAFKFCKGELYEGEGAY